MADSSTAHLERTLEESPTWAVAVVCFVLLAVSIFIEHVIHRIGHWLQGKHKIALYEALEKIKAELMLLGFISLLLTVLQQYISEICVPVKVADSWHPCDANANQKRADYVDKCYKKGKVAFLSKYALHQLHIFIFVLALFHVLYCIITLALGRTKMRKWKVWEDETKRIEYLYNNDPERFRFTRDTSFGRRHLHLWSQSPITLWIVCFFRQFYGSVITKVDYLTLRHGFIMAHLAPESETKFDFHKYINRSLEEDFKVVVAISPVIWFFAVLFLLSNTYGIYSYLWLPFIPLIIILLVGAKLQVIITKMGLRIQERGDIVKGAPLVQPGDDLFWFGKPKFMLFLIHFVLFQNAFQLAFFSWSTYAFSINSCFHKRTEDIVIRVSMGVVIQVLCSYVTLPLYALVTQMGSTMKPTIFNDRVATALKKWHHTAKKNTKHSRHSEANSPFSSRPATPTYGMSPVHLLHNYRSSTAPDSFQNSPRHLSNVDNINNNNNNDFYDPEGSSSPSRRHHHHHNNNNDINANSIVVRHDHIDTISEEAVQAVQHDRPASSSSQHEVKITMSEFTFGK